MCFKRKPFAHATNIFEIPADFYKKLGIKTLFIDLDNTLDSYKLFTPTKRAEEYIRYLQDNNINPVIISNNRGKRVSSYANSLDIPFVHSARKPFAGKINKYIKEHNLNKDEIMLVGDQMITDVGAGNKAKIKVILTEKIVNEDQWTTHFNRILDKPIRRRQLKKGLLKDWRMFYGKD